MDGEMAGEITALVRASRRGTWPDQEWDSAAEVTRRLIQEALDKRAEDALRGPCPE